MAEKKRRTFTGMLIKFITAIPVLFSLISNIFSIVEYEMSLAGRNIGFLLIFSLFAFILLFSTWFTLLALFFFFLLSVHYSVLFSLSIILVLNILIFLLICFRIMYIKTRLGFPVTRQLLSDIPKISKIS